MSIPVDPEIIEEVATELAVNEAFVEKDWYALHLVALILTAPDTNYTPVFSGGTSLSKGFNLIQRFSEDLDFKMLLPNSKSNTRKKRSNYRKALTQLISETPGWILDQKDIKARNENNHFSFSVGYESIFPQHYSLRPHLKLEINFVSPSWDTQQCSLQSFIAQAQGEEPEVPDVPCVSPIETAADKLSALTWRVLSRKRGVTGDDPALIRHLYDLAVLENYVRPCKSFPELARDVLQQDQKRGQQDSYIQEMTSAERVSEAFNLLGSDAEYQEEYERFVTGMCYAADEETPSFSEALETAKRFLDLVF